MEQHRLRTVRATVAVAVTIPCPTGQPDPDTTGSKALGWGKKLSHVGRSPGAGMQGAGMPRHTMLCGTTDPMPHSWHLLPIPCRFCILSVNCVLPILPMIVFTHEAQQWSSHWPFYLSPYGPNPGFHTGITLAKISPCGSGSHERIFPLAPNLPHPSAAFLSLLQLIPW